MAEKLSVEIALEGGAEIERQLADIGEAGQKAFNDIVKASEQVGGFRNIKPEEVTAKLNAMGLAGTEAFGKIQRAVTAASRLEGVASGVQKLENAFSGLGGAVTKFGDSMTRSLGPIGVVMRALGPVGVTLGLLGAAWIKSTFDAVNSINELSTAAMKLGVPIEQLDKLRLGLEAAGISAKAITGGLGQVQKDFDKFQVDQVTRNLKELQDAATRGFGGLGTRQLQELQKAAEQFTPAGEAARKALQTLGLPIPGTTVQDIKELGIEMARLKGLGIDIKVNDTAVTAIQKIIDTLQKMPDGVQRSALAIKLLGDTAGPELVRAMQTGSLAVDTFKNKHIEASQTLQQEALEAGKFEQSLNRLSSTWSRFNSLTLSPALRGGFDFLSTSIQKVQGWLIQFGSQLTQSGQGWMMIFTGIGNAATAAWQLVKDGAAAAMQFINDWVLTPVEGAWQWITDTWDGIVSWFGTKLDEATALLTAWVTTPIANAWQWIKDKWDAMVRSLFGKKGGSSGEGEAAAAGAGMASGGLLGGRGTGTSDSNLAWVSRGEYIVPARVVQQPGVLAFLEALRRSGRLAGHAAGGLIPAYASGGEVKSIPTLDKVIEQLHQVFDIIKGAAEAAMESSGSINESLKQTAFRTFDELNKVGWDVYRMARSVDETLGKAADILLELKGKAEGKAGGGLIGGGGTGTSDSNLAWVSRGEHIMPAGAVSQPGVLAFLEALRRSGGSLRDVLDGMGRFALGGMVRGPIGIPAFAGGGMNNVTIQFPGLPEITGLRASSGVVDELRKAAALAQVRSGGRKPSRYS